ncbi:MAG: hypothetical protein H6704_31480, partial [Myxococcales bacterium]|nr:hypothetical protein [Myxococcales bacterium]
MRAKQAALFLSLLPLVSWARPEGTRDLQTNQGLVGRTPVNVFLRVGETLRVCSSDDGHNDTGPLYGDCLGPACGPDDGPAFVIDHDVDRARPVLAEREGAEILVSPPADRPCRGQQDCVAPYTCRARPDGALWTPRADAGYCAASFAVVRGGVGYCSAFTDPAARAWHTVTATEEGHWTVDFVGEAHTLIGQTEPIVSTRFFEIDVLERGGRTVEGGRVSARAWALTSHQPAYGQSADFYIVSGGQVAVLDLEDLRGTVYTVQANSTGLRGHPRQSWCVYGDPNGRGECAARPTGSATEPPAAEHRLYLNFPSPTPAAVEPTLTDVRFEDEAGTATVSPNGDGEQDAGDFYFRSNVPGTYAITIDTNGDGRIDEAEDRVLFGTARVGQNRVPWDVRDAAGAVLPAGDYAVRVRLIAGEVHVVFSDVEDNADGFVFWRQARPDGGRVPLPMFWDDRAVRSPAELLLTGGLDALTTVEAGSVVP